jgi:hypothetical protein
LFTFRGKSCGQVLASWNAGRFGLHRCSDNAECVYIAEFANIAEFLGKNFAYIGLPLYCVSMKFLDELLNH